MRPRSSDPSEEIATLVRPPVRPAAVTPTFVLVVVHGPESGTSFTLDGRHPARVLIGTSPACEFRLSDPHASRRHAGFDLCDDEIRVSDVGSTNGTFVNEVKTTEAYVRGGETIRIGETALRVERSEAATRTPLSTATRFGKVVGSSIELRRLYPLCEKLAATNVPVVIEGESGTGKEVLAESLHEASGRASGPFIVFDCTTVPPNLLESELFGHERGAFTGATAMRKGLFEQAHNGTLFIDEIGDLDLALQPKLLRAIQSAEVRRVGGHKWIPVDVRLLAATRRNLDQEVQAGRFRDDLFFRLAVARIELPPLRARRGDVSVLAHHFWKELGGTGALPYELLQRCESYAWPGNVRELHNEISRRIALGDLAGTGPSLSTATEEAEPSAQPSAPADFMQEVLSLDLPLPLARERVVEEFQRRYVTRVVAAYGGNVSRAAAASGIAHRYFQILRARQGKR